MKQAIKLLFLGDIFGEPGIQKVEELLPTLIKDYQVDFVIAQSENVSGRKGLIKADYLRLKKAGVDAFTLGNHVWSKQQIHEIIDNHDVIRPLNIETTYPGSGLRVFEVKKRKIAVLSLMGIAFNKLLAPWNEEQALNFFDAMDDVLAKSNADFHFVDFHAETTSEKNVLGLYLDGKVDALIGTHTHVQTNDARVLPNGTVYMTDAGMVGPINSAIGANYNEVYENMRYDKRKRFQVSPNESQLNGVIIKLGRKNKIVKVVNIQPS